MRAILLALALVGADKSGFTSFRSAPNLVLEGNWQSCREADGQYAERVYDYFDPERRRSFEFHFGPYHEFALFAGVQDEHRDHGSSANLLQPYTIGAPGEQLSRHTWIVAGFRIRVALAGGSFNDCESWFVTVQRK